MSFRDCILKNIQKGLVDQEEGEAMLKQFDKLSQKHSVKDAVDKLSQFEAEKLVKEQMNVYKHMKFRSQIMGEINGAKTIGAKNKVMRDKLQYARDKSEVFYENFTTVLNAFVGDFDADLDPALFRQVYKSLIDGTDSSNPKVKQLADGFKKMFDHVKNESDVNGLIMGDLGERFTPRFYEKAKIRKVNDADFVEVAKKHMVSEGMTDDEFALMVLDGKRDIETDGLYSKSKEMFLEEDGDTPFAYKKNLSRKWQFKDSESYLKFNEAFGKGDAGLGENIVRYMHGMSQDLGVVTVMGPNPQGIMDEAMLKLDLLGKQAKAQPGFRAKARRISDISSTKTLQSEFNVLTQQAFTGDRENELYKAFQASQNILRAAQLGSAMVSALTDPAFGVISQKLSGGSGARLFGDYLALTKGIVGQKSLAKNVADELGYLAETYNGMMVGDTRMSLGGEGKGVSKKLADLTFNLSGLDAWTKNGRILAKVNGNQNIATQIKLKVPWDELDPGLRTQLERVGLNSETWGKTVKNAKTFDRGGRTFFNTNELRLSKDIGFGEAAQIADQIDSVLVNIKNLTVNESNLTTDAITSGAVFGGGTSSVSGKMLANALFQYKNFAVTVMNNHTIPAIRRAVVDRKLDHLAMLAIGTGVFAAIPLQLREVLKGRTTKDMNTPEFWIAAMAQGGGLGILGDFMFTDTSRYGNSLTDTFAGPYVGTVSDIADVGLAAARRELVGKGESKDKARQRAKKRMFGLLKRTIPLNNLWYTRLLLERVLFDNLQRLIDPNFDNNIRRYEKKIKKQAGQEYWWRPGDAPKPEKLLGD